MMRERAGVEVSCGSFATEAALNIYKARRIAFFSPYFPVANAQVRRFYEDCGFTVVRDLCLQRPSPVQIAHTTDDMAATRCARSTAMMWTRLCRWAPICRWCGLQQRPNFFWTSQ